VKFGGLADGFVQVGSCDNFTGVDQPSSVCMAASAGLESYCKRGGERRIMHVVRKN
jgi:hypothetical protein